MSTKEDGRDCDNQRDRPINVLIAVKETGEKIFEGRATCGDVENSAAATYVIEQVEGEFVVRDPFD